ncbi:peptidoglycan recognition protein family protein [Priestia endophytica]|uniref:peptidoglycan recognition protein family protein n=1 Tax=Priestia endophytica TaxID=135735 RepID=UPI0027E0F2D1|nr:N-acetylmuramoyl-L-alanine amidase [Priestia endophytica]
MTIPVRQKLVSSSKYNIKCPYTMNASYITFHNTANDASAENEVSYMNSNNNQVSYHFAVDDKEVVQALPVNRSGWHCGDGKGAKSGNRTSIGVEICYSKSGGERYKKAEELGIKFIAQLLHEYGWGVNRVKRHQEWSGKYCPHRVLQEGRWNEVLQRIQSELNALQGETPVTQSGPSTSIAPTLLKRGDAGTYVKGLQGKLQSLGFNIGKYGIDGQYGPSTETAVKAFQKKYGLAADGIAGQLTLNKLDQVYKAAQQPKETPVTPPKKEEPKVDTSKLPVSKQFELEVKKATERGITNGARPQDIATREEAMVMAKRAGDFQAFQVEEIYKTFVQVKDKLPLEKPKKWEETFKNGDASIQEVLYFLAQLTLRSFK